MPRTGKWDMMKAALARAGKLPPTGQPPAAPAQRVANPRAYADAGITPPGWGDARRDLTYIREQEAKRDPAAREAEIAAQNAHMEKLRGAAPQPIDRNLLREEAVLKSMPSPGPLNTPEEKARIAQYEKSIMERNAGNVNPAAQIARPPLNPPRPAAPRKLSIGQKFMKGINKTPKALQVAHAMLNPITGVPMAIASNWGSIKKGAQKIGSGIKRGWNNFKSGFTRLGRGFAGGIANAFRRKKK
jgi:hypothetical protein